MCPRCIKLLNSLGLYFDTEYAETNSDQTDFPAVKL